MNSWSKVCCPRDGLPLEAGKFQEVELTRCPDCQGVLVDQWRLEALLSRMSEALMETVLLDQPLAPLEDRGGGILCPNCRGATEHYGYMGADLVMIDRCPKCNVIWFDADELGAASVLYTRTRKRVEFRLLQRAPRDVDAANSLEGKRLGKSVTQLMTIGFVPGKPV